MKIPKGYGIIGIFQANLVDLLLTVFEESMERYRIRCKLRDDMGLPEEEMGAFPIIINTHEQDALLAAFGDEVPKELIPFIIELQEIKEGAVFLMPGQEQNDPTLN